jgi:quinol-cytochrome oxidoreductase complex cytochrome b subunit
MHTLSFLLHLRPRTYPEAAIRFSHTFHLGFFAVFLLLVELISGLFLMVYYQPTPEGAYPSLLRIMGEVPLGALVRDIHRLAGEAMIVCVLLHLLRIFLSGAYKGKRRFTWVLGVGLLIGTLGFAFTGYLRPWDQRAYWAVTIGTSMIESIPLVGPGLNLLIRGGPDIGASGLLRFNLMHIIALPLATALLLGAHYYRVSRFHGISLPAHLEDKRSPEARRQIAYMPEIFTREVLLSCAGLLVLVLVALFFYDAPLEHHANPRRTPLDTQAPWFFLWLQGLLKIGDKVVMGIVVPLLFLVILVGVPFLDRNPDRLPNRRPWAIFSAVAAISTLLALSYMGTHHYGIHLPAAERIAQNLAPQEGMGPVHRIPYEALPVGIYDIDSPDEKGLNGILGEVFYQFRDQVRSADDAGELPDATGLMMIEEWQADLKRVTLRIGWNAPDGTGRKSFERIVPLHRER